MDGSLRLSPGRAHLRRLLDLAPAVLLGVAAFALYAKTLAPTILVGDGGEFQFAPYMLGIAHPTGYPLYCLLGWAWSHLLSVRDVAYRMNLFSAFWAGMAVGLLYPTARMLLRRSVPALPAPVHGLIAALAAASFAVTPTFWSQAIIAEVYSFHTFFVVLLFLLLLAWAERPSRRYLLLVALTCALGLTHHRTTLLLFPAIVAYLWLSDRSVFRDRRLILGALPLLLLPLALYLYIPLRAPHTPYLNLPLNGERELILYDNTLSGFVDFVLGGPFGSSVDLSVDLGDRLAMAWGFLRNQVGWIGIGLALVGLAGLAVTGPHPPRPDHPVPTGEHGQDRQAQAGSGRGSRAVMALTGLTYLTLVAFNLIYTIGDVFVLYIPSYVVVVLWLAAGVGFLVQIGRRLASKWQWASALAVLPFFVLPLYVGIGYYAKVDQSQNSAARTGWEAILAGSPPSGALLISNDRNEIMPLWYFQYVDGRRPDLLGLFPLITADYPSLGHVLDLALSTDRPIYLVKEMPGVGVKVRVEAEGQLWQIMGPAVEEEPTYALTERLDDALLLVGYDRSPHSPRPGRSLQISLHWEALRSLEATYHSFVHLLDAKGHKVAQSDQQPGGDYYPTTLWRRGERLRDDHTLTVPLDAPVGVYHLLVGMYALSADGTLEPLGEPVSFGQLEISESLP
jgi:hypothetical protein